MITYRVPLLGIKLSTNQSYAGIHWTKRKAIKDSVLSIVFGVCRPVLKVDSYPVDIRYRYVFKTRALDTLNTAIISKMLEDALCSIGVLEDDSPHFVKRSILEVDVLPKEKRSKSSNAQRPQAGSEDFVEITITPHDQS